jgi:FkbM family methyltransferase
MNTLKANYFNKDILLDQRTSMYGGSFLSNLTVYDVDKVQDILDYLRTLESPTLIDVGASTGSYSLLPTIIEDLKVHSFEPSKAFEVLKNNIDINNISDNVILNKNAVAEEKKVGWFNEVVSKNDSCLALSMLDGVPAGHKVVRKHRVDVICLDDYCKDIKTDVIKIDVEGAELSVIQGAMKTIERDKPLVMFEFSDENANQYGYNHKSCIDLLETIGYTSKRDNNDVIATYEK